MPPIFMDPEEDDIDQDDLLHDDDEAVVVPGGGARLRPLKLPVSCKPHLAWQDNWHPYRSPGRLKKKPYDSSLSPIDPKRDPQVQWAKEQARLRESHQRNMLINQNTDRVVEHVRSQLRAKQNKILNEGMEERKVSSNQERKEREMSRQRKRHGKQEIGKKKYMETSCLTSGLSGKK